MKGLIVSNGEISDLNILKSVIKDVDFIVCADGGTNHIAAINVMPDLVVGDLDSISSNTLEKIESNNINIERYNPKKDATDTELATEYLIEKGFKEIIFMGVTGSRIDHTLGNILILDKLLKRGIKGVIIDENNRVYITDSELCVSREEGTFVSIIPITSNGAKVTLTGFEYETDRVEFGFSSTLGISNRVVEENGYIKVENGTCLVIISKD
ncbi:thiamine diphosphokinase [Anaerosalibacter sp. Marseille-P3206]|uniref:thiamine diphosphokinase n=1 Tax=Anaerosalibacter sp. Marseille-P3206 TaxID=1871005 RepID=UPI000987866D|nr:thiamine diphosphokinase [Anaerosalibacter sp. Marseille-P3206]